MYKKCSKAPNKRIVKLNKILTTNKYSSIIKVSIEGDKMIKKAKEYNVYIDESGDEGINKGSKYFILTAIIVEKDKDLEASKLVDEIKELLELGIKNNFIGN